MRSDVELAVQNAQVLQAYTAKTPFERRMKALNMRQVREFVEAQETELVHA